MRTCAALCVVVAAVAAVAEGDRAAHVSFSHGHRFHKQAKPLRHHHRRKLSSSSSHPASYNPLPPLTTDVTLVPSEAEPGYDVTQPSVVAPTPALTLPPATTATYRHHDPLAKPPACSHNTTKDWCIEDSLYPLHEVQKAVTKHLTKVQALYADVAGLNTLASVAGRPQSLQEETYLCKASVAYVKPLRAVNAAGRWRIVVNGARAGYDELTQTQRLEECEAPLQTCPLLPLCLSSRCLQQTSVQRLLVWDPSDPYFPFAIDVFPLPSACSCQVDQYIASH